MKILLGSNIESFFFNMNEINYLKELQKENGYHLFMKMRERRFDYLFDYMNIAKFISSFMVIYFLLNEYFYFKYFVIAFGIILLTALFHDFYFYKVVTNFVDFCKSIVKFENYVKFILKLPDNNKCYINIELERIFKQFSYELPTNDKSDLFKLWLSQKAFLFRQIFEDYEFQFCQKKV
jgi:hypothetical protein